MNEDFGVSVDVTILAIVSDSLCVLLSPRAVEPHRGMLALPGSSVALGEDLIEAARRVLVHTTGTDNLADPLQVETFGAPGRDQRGRVVSVAYVAVLDTPTATSLRPQFATWQAVETVGEIALAFDHAQILGRTLQRVRARLEYTSLATAFLAPEFTLSELRRVYELAWGKPLDPGNFQRKFRHTEGFLEPTGAQRRMGRGRPAAVFRAAGPTPSVLASPFAREKTSVGI